MLVLTAFVQRTLADITAVPGVVSHDVRIALGGSRL